MLRRKPKISKNITTPTSESGLLYLRTVLRPKLACKLSTVLLRVEVVGPIDIHLESLVQALSTSGVPAERENCFPSSRWIRVSLFDFCRHETLSSTSCCIHRASGEERVRSPRYGVVEAWIKVACRRWQQRWQSRRYGASHDPEWRRAGNFWRIKQTTKAGGRRLERYRIPCAGSLTPMSIRNFAISS